MSDGGSYASWQPKKSQKIALIVTGDFCDNNEYVGALVALTSAHYHVDTLAAGKRKGETFRTAVHVHEANAPLTYTEYRGYDFKATTSDAEASRVKYDAVFITGGRSPEQARDFPKIIKIVQDALDRESTVVAAICHGPELLIAAGLTGIAMSGSTLIKDVVTKSGNTFEKGRVVVVDRTGRGSIITAPPTHIGIMMSYLIDKNHSSAMSSLVPKSHGSSRGGRSVALLVLLVFLVLGTAVTKRRKEPGSRYV